VSRAVCQDAVKYRTGVIGSDGRRSIGEPPRNYQPPPLVRKRRMKRSCSEEELTFTSLSMNASNEKIVQLDIFRIVPIVSPSRQ
jgi:hypothetical protein